ncbi:hypothetical protein OROMI_033901 [Orobanche minor]
MESSSSQRDLPPSAFLVELVMGMSLVSLKQPTTWDVP